MISAPTEKYEDSYITYKTSKELWDSLKAKFGVSDADSEFYIMKQLYDYRMVENHSIVE